MSGNNKEPSPSKQSVKDKGGEFAIELQPTGVNKAAAKTDDLFGGAPEQDPNLPKKAPPKEAKEEGGNASDDGFENKFDDQTKKKATKKKKKKAPGAVDEEA